MPASKQSSQRLIAWPTVEEALRGDTTYEAAKKLWDKWDLKLFPPLSTDDYFILTLWLINRDQSYQEVVVKLLRESVVVIKHRRRGR